MRWRFIPYSEQDAFMNMAIDEMLSEKASGGDLPVVRFYGWKPSAVSIGYFQSMEREVDIDSCKRRGIDIVRRRTGGGAVYHDQNREITYSVIGKEELFPKNIIESYKLICGWITSSLSSLGIESEFAPINDILTNGRKISGNAQTRRQGVLLQHGTILYDIDPERMFSVLRVPDEKTKHHMISSVKERVTSILEEKHVERPDLLKALREGFLKDKETEIKTLSRDELETAKKIRKRRYLEKEWNFQR